MADSPQFQNFDRLMGQMLSVPKKDVERIVADEKKQPRPAKPSK